MRLRARWMVLAVLIAGNASAHAQGAIQGLERIKVPLALDDIVYSYKPQGILIQSFSEAGIETLKQRDGCRAALLPVKEELYYLDPALAPEGKTKSFNPSLKALSLAGRDFTGPEDGAEFLMGMSLEATCYR